MELSRNAMTELNPTLASSIAATVAGIFAIVSPFVTWKLKDASDERARLIAMDKERRDEIKRLYTDVFVQFEQAIRQVMQGEMFSLGQDVSESTAKIRLLATGENRHAVFRKFARC